MISVDYVVFRRGYGLRAHCRAGPEKNRGRKTSGSSFPALPAPRYGYGNYIKPSLNLSDFKVLSISMVMVIGPTPPGTGVM